MDSGTTRGVADEADCGICAFMMHSLRPLGGVIKVHPEDFRVREIPIEGPFPPAPGHPQAFWRFTLHKCGVDTLEAINSLSSECRVSSRSFGLGGIKDSWAVTTQEMTVARDLIDKMDLLEAAKTLPNLRILACDTSSKPLAPGMLAGNNFLIRVREVGASARRVRAAMRSLRRRGFLNYVGMQRFGKRGIRSDLLGLAYLQRDYERCVGLILRQSGEETGTTGIHHRLPKWAEVFKRTNCADAALRAMPSAGCWTERRLLRALQRCQTKCLNRPVSEWSEAARASFLTLPKSIRCLYGHAYIDRLWNLSATERVLRLGLSCVDGDLVSDPSCPDVVRVLGQGIVGKVEPSMHDVLLPRPGIGTQMPTHEIGPLMNSYLAYDGLDSSNLRLESSVPKSEGHVLVGALRPLVSRPKRMRWSMERDQTDCHPSRRPRTLVLDFGLAPGQYATMALREVMRRRPLQRPPQHVVFSDSE